MDNTYALQLTYFIKTNSNLGDLESYNVACAIEPFVQALVSTGVSDQRTPLACAVDELTSAVEEVIAKKNGGYRAGENDGVLGEV